MGNSILAQYLEDCECIQGDTMTLTYEFFDGDGNPLDLRRAKMYVTFCPYGQYNSPALTKQGIVSSGAPKHLCGQPDQRGHHQPEGHQVQPTTRHFNQ